MVECHKCDQVFDDREAYLDHLVSYHGMVRVNISGRSTEDDDDWPDNIEQTHWTWITNYPAEPSKGDDKD